MNQLLTFSVPVRAPRPRVWERMLSDDGYRDWTSAFCEGSHFEGSWEQGKPIRFLAPDGSGMTAVVAESRPPEFLSIRHLGEVVGGVDDTTSDRVRAWAPAHENYTLADADGGTRLTVTMECAPEFEPMMREAFPKALARLQALCEAPGRRAAPPAAAAQTDAATASVAPTAAAAAVAAAPAAAATAADDAAAFDLVLERTIDVPVARLWRCWTEAPLLMQWFCPRPWRVVRADWEPRPGAACCVVMQGPDGTEMPNPGVFLEVVPQRRLVTTDAYVRAWVPAPTKPFLTTVVTFDDLGSGRTRYVARARHWSAEDRDTHLRMGFHEGWGIAADQLAALARTLP